MFIVKIIGGMGNQMFQYALGRSLSLNQQEDLYLDTTGFKSYKLWNYKLDVFQISPAYTTPYLNFRVSLAKRNSWKFLPPAKFCIFSERYFSYNSEIENIKQNCYFDGYWQTEKYFQNIRPTLLKDFQLKSPLDSTNAAQLDLIKKTNSVSVHIRRGDYVTDANANKFHGVLPLSYYENAVRELKQIESDLHFFIFSDDPEWTKNYFKIEGPVSFITNNMGRGEEDLRLMQSCRHNIIANSSFSWWAAWLNENPGKNVLAPSAWFKDSTLDTKDLIPSNWLRVHFE